MQCSLPPFFSKRGKVLPQIHSLSNGPSSVSITWLQLQNPPHTQTRLERAAKSRRPTYLFNTKTFQSKR